MSDEALFKAIGLEDMTMPGGWSVSDGQTVLPTPGERGLMRQARAFAQREILPHSAEAHRQVKQIFRNARLLRIGAGSDEIMKFLIAREVLREIRG
jgi:hypothetical protein